MSFEAIFWDNDGVLVDTEAVFIKACREVFADEGVEISEGWFINESLAKGRSAFDLARKKGMSNENIKNTKPDPEPYLNALEIAGKPCESCLVVGESQRGVVAAKAAGLSCYAIPS